MTRLYVDKQTQTTTATIKCVDNWCLIWFTFSRKQAALWKTEEKCINSGQNRIGPANSRQKWPSSVQMKWLHKSPLVRGSTVLRADQLTPQSGFRGRSRSPSSSAPRWRGTSPSISPSSARRWSHRRRRCIRGIGRLGAGNPRSRCLPSGRLAS